jgi:hypothetical protein
MLSLVCCSYPPPNGTFRECDPYLLSEECQVRSTPCRVWCLQALKLLDCNKCTLIVVNWSLTISHAHTYAPIYVMQSPTSGAHTHAHPCPWVLGGHGCDVIVHGWAWVRYYRSWVGMGGHRSLLMIMVWVWVQIQRKMLGSNVMPKFSYAQTSAMTYNRYSIRRWLSFG